MITGFHIGHHEVRAPGWQTGTTVIAARDGATAGVDVRGGGPGTRETDALDPTTLVQQVHALVLTGGSAYGLAAADGVMQALAEEHIGFPVGTEPHEVVPIVPAAVIFDLGRGGEFGNRPTAEFGRLALANASGADPAQGTVGAGTGAVCGGVAGGFGYAELTIDADQPITIGAAAVVNAAGSAVNPDTGRLWADRAHRLPAPSAAQRTALQEARNNAASINTTIGVILTDATLTKAQANKVAQVAHDGLARAITPVHSMTDGDTIFCLASGTDTPLPHTPAGITTFNAMLDKAAEAFTEACLNAMIHAESHGRWQSYTDLTT
ncbi:P1 family peptidase [Enemella sp. A6]|uniref:P1 family peptidase n=1 Tax=Enemella sp. A6 TaxID=3440152 RepID=UPI003EB9CD0A